MYPGVNTLTGEGASYTGVGAASHARAGGRDRSMPATDHPRPGLIPDGTEFVVAALVLGALVLLASLEAGGFKTVIAASITAN